MKTHKIRNIDKSVCTVEQVIAYNMGFSDLEYGKELFRDYYEDEARRRLFRMRDIHIQELKKKKGANTVNFDAVFCAYNAGIIDYIKSDGSGICWNYEQVGKTFPLLYSVE